MVTLKTAHQGRIRVIHWIMDTLFRTGQLVGLGTAGLTFMSQRLHKSRRRGVFVLLSWRHTAVSQALRD